MGSYRTRWCRACDRAVPARLKWGIMDQLITVSTCGAWFFMLFYRIAFDVRSCPRCHRNVVS